MFRHLLRWLGIPSRPTSWDRKDRTVWTWRKMPRPHSSTKRNSTQAVP